MFVQRANSIRFAYSVIHLLVHLVYPTVHALSGYSYALDTEYSSANFFDGWDFFTDNDPTGGFVTYYSRSSARLAGLINSSDTAPIYIGADYVNELPITSTGAGAGAGRPSVRISSKLSWTHGLFIGDFNHAPSGICGTWPAFWTLGPNWPYTGEVDIMEGVNKVDSNAVSLHTNETCIISSNSATQLGVLSNSNCAYYPGYNVGCGVVDSRLPSYSDFNSVGGGVYAMQWTSEYIRVWFWSRDRIPNDIANKTPNPSGWGLPAADLRGNCTIDQHFQQHKIVFDNTFCGEYAGNPYVWNSTVNSCANATGYATCDAFVAKNPAVFQDAYWSINSVRVYQLIEQNLTAPQPQYIASLQPTSAVSSVSPSPASAVQPTGSLCPNYNFTVVSNERLQYEIECSFDLPGPDLPPPYTNYPIHSFEDCVNGCTYWNTVNGTNLCGAVSYDASIPFCYFKKYIDQPPKYRSGFAGARLIYYGYPQITDDPRSQTSSSTSSTFVEIIPTPQYYRPFTISSTQSSAATSYNTTSIPIQTIAPPLGTATNETVRPTVNSGSPTVSFSGTVSISVPDSTSSISDTVGMIPSTKFIISEPIETQAAINSTETVSSSGTISVDIPASTTLSTGPLPLSPSSSHSSSEHSTTTTKNGANGFPGPTQLGSYIYIGCGSRQDRTNDFLLSETPAEMTIERCLSSCGRSYLAGIHDRDCYCSNSTTGDNKMVLHPDSSCNIACPGDSFERCGGTVFLDAVNASISRRWEETLNTSLFLFTLYRNSAFASQEPILQPLSTSQTPVLYDATATNTIVVTEIATTWCDYCSTCPSYETTLATTITIPCSIAEGPVSTSPPTIPMVTATRSCDCGQDGVAAVTTVTVPDEAGIALLTLSAAQLMASPHTTTSADNTRTEEDDSVKPTADEELPSLTTSYSIISAVGYLDTLVGPKVETTKAQAVSNDTPSNLLVSVVAVSSSPQQQSTLLGSGFLSPAYPGSPMISYSHINATTNTTLRTTSMIPLSTYTGGAVECGLKQFSRLMTVVWSLSLFFLGIDFV